MMKNSLKNTFFLAGSALVLSSCGLQKKAAEDTVMLDTIVVKPEPRPVYRASNTITTDIQHMRLDLAFNWDSSFVLGKARITLKPYFYDLRKIELDARGFQINEVAELKGEERNKLTYEYDGKKLIINPGRTLKKGELFTLFIDYTAMPNKLKSEGSMAITDNRGLYFINPDGKDPDKPRQIWTQGETQANSAWFPTVDSPNEKFTHELYVTIEQDQTSISNGMKMFSVDNSDGTKTEYWKMDKPNAAYLVMLAVGPFGVVRDHWDEMEVNYYLDSAYIPDAKAIFGNTPEMLNFYSDYLGVKYPWPKYDQVVVHDYVSGAMENTTATIHGKFLQLTRRELIDNDYETVIAHELFHHWFGDLVTCESWSNLTLNEGFATYGEHLWNEHKYGDDEAAYYLAQDLQSYLYDARNKEKDLIRFYYESREDMFDGHSYAKGGRILHMLRQVVGEEAFRESLKKYLTDYAYQNAEVHHLRLTFESVTGEDLNWFFNQWFLASGHPSLEVDHAYDATKGVLTIHVKQNQNLETTPLYRLPVDVTLGTKSGFEIHRLVIDSLEQSFDMDISQQPLYVDFDHKAALVCVKEEHQSTEEWMAQYRHAKDYAGRDEALDKLNTADTSMAEPVFREALKDLFWALRLTAMRYLKTALEKETDGKLKAIYIDIAKNDEESQLRAAAIRYLRSLPKDEVLMNLFKDGLNDSSYAVIGSSFLAVAAHDKDLAKTLFSKLSEDDPNGNLVPAQSQFLSTNGSPSDLDWFAEAIDSREGFARYQVVRYFGDFLENQSDSVLLAGIPILDHIMQDSTEVGWIRAVTFSTGFDLNKVIKERLAEVEKSLKGMKEDNPNKVVQENRLALLKKAVETLDASLNEYNKNRKGANE